MNQSETYWDSALAKYGTKDWIDKPTIFVEQAVQYFPKGGKVLELAAGRGQDSRYLARVGFDVVCTDLSDFGLEEAKRKSEQEKLSIEFRKVDLSKLLPFQDNEFDVAYSHLGLHYFNKQDTIALLKEIRRVLKSGGILAALFNTVDDPELKGEGFEKIEDDYYREVSNGLQKRYFSVDSARGLIAGFFEPIILDNKGSSHKDGETKLIRLIAKAIK